jgi:two-component system OmpR family sensor kinase
MYEGEASVGGAWTLSPEAVMGLVHDLRTPLQVIRGECFTLRRRGVSPPQGAVLSTIDAEVDRISTALDDLLRLAALPPAAPIGPVALADVVRDVAERRRRAAAAHDVRIDVRVHGKAVVRARRGDLERAVDNLLANAVRHSPRGGRVTVEVSAGPGHGVVRVADRGSGVHRFDRERIFRPGDRGRRPRGRGHGLGLAIVGEVARTHGGRLDLEPDGPGAVFRLSLPLADRRLPQ